MTRNTWIAIIAIALVAGLSIFFWVIEPATRAVKNTHDYVVNKVDEATNYQTKKDVEDSCRAMIASYEADKSTYELYKDNDDDEKQGWAEQARMRANRTVSTYNNYMLKNTFVWAGNVPNDIKAELEQI